MKTLRECCLNRTAGVRFTRANAAMTSSRLAVWSWQQCVSLPSLAPERRANYPTRNWRRSRRGANSWPNSANVLYWRGVGGATLNETNLSGQNQYKNVYFNGEQVARQDPSGALHYPLHDQVGSTRASVLVSSQVPNGQQETDLDYYPFGTVVASSGSDSSGNPYKFTGKERDGETGNDYFEARYTNASVSRFFSVDPGNYSGFAHPEDPQAWNAYSYVRNNPLSYTDPSGKDYDYRVTSPGGSVGGHIDDGGFWVWLQGYIDHMAGTEQWQGSLFGSGSVTGFIGGISVAISWTHLADTQQQTAQQQNKGPSSSVTTNTYSATATGLRIILVGTVTGGSYTGYNGYRPSRLAIRCQASPPINRIPILILVRRRPST